MDAIRKVVGAMGGETEGAPLEQQRRSSTATAPDEPSAAGGGASGVSERERLQSSTTTQTSRTEPREQEWQTREQPMTRRSDESQLSSGARGEEKSRLGEERLERTGETPLDSDTERQRRLQQQQQREVEKEAELREREQREPQRDFTREQRDLERQLLERESGKGGESTGEKIKGAMGMGGGAAMARSEETRQLGFEQGQVPLDDQAKAAIVRRRYQDEQEAIRSGHPYEGQRVKDPEYYRTTFLRTADEEKLSEQRWAERRWAERGGGGGATGREEERERGGYEREGREPRRGGREEEGFFGRTMHEIAGAVGLGGAAGAGLGALTSRSQVSSVSSVTAYPMCLRVLLRPRPDLRDSELEGDILLVQNSPTSPTQVIGSCRGINPGLHGMVILENGDLSLGRSSAGLHFDAKGSTASHGGANTKERHLGDLGNIVVKDDGVSFFNFTVDNLPLLDVSGRSLAVMSGEDDLGQSSCQCPPGSCKTKESGPHKKCGPDCRGAAGGCFACISERTGNSGHALGLGILFRTDLRAMERLKNVRLGVGVGKETHREVWGRPMEKRPDVEREEEGGRERGRRAGMAGGAAGGWQQFKESLKSTFGGGEERERGGGRDLRGEERERWERGQIGRRGQEVGEREPYRTREEYLSREQQPSRGRYEGGGREERQWGERSYAKEEEPRGYYESRGRSSYEPKEREYGGGREWGESRKSYEQPTEQRIRGTDIGSKMQWQERPVASGRSAHADY